MLAFGRGQSRHNLVSGGSEDPNHDAAMRIGSEAPKRRTHSFPRRAWATSWEDFLRTRPGERSAREYRTGTDQSAGIRAFYNLPAAPKVCIAANFAAGVGFGSKARITASQHFCPLHLNEQPPDRRGFYDAMCQEETLRR